MEKEQLKRIFDFLEEKEEHRAPFLWKFKNNEPLIEEDLNVKGDLNLHYSKITSLPKGLKVGGYLSLYLIDITSLPNDLTVDGALFLMGSKITSLPEGLKVGGNLHIDNTPLKKYTNKQLREMIKPGVIKGKIYRR